MPKYDLSCYNRAIKLKNTFSTMPNLLLTKCFVLHAWSKPQYRRNNRGIPQYSISCATQLYILVYLYGINYSIALYNLDNTFLRQERTLFQHFQ